MEIKVLKKSYHRNGIAGNGFDIVEFSTVGDPDTRGRRMIAVLFEEQGNCAVLDIDELAKDNIEFAKGNSWRGDHFEPELRKAIEEVSNAR